MFHFKVTYWGGYGGGGGTIYGMVAADSRESARARLEICYPGAHEIGVDHVQLSAVLEEQRVGECPDAVPLGPTTEMPKAKAKADALVYGPRARVIQFYICHACDWALGEMGLQDGRMREGEFDAVALTGKPAADAEAACALCGGPASSYYTLVS